MRKRQIKALKKSIKQWKIIYELLYHDVYDNFMSAKIQSLKRMGEPETLFKLCFLCHEFHDSINKTCHGCPMVGHWPNINDDNQPLELCYSDDSSYMHLEQNAFGIMKGEEVNRILTAMEERLNKLERKKRQIKALKKSIKQWKIIYRLAKEDNSNKLTDITDAKSKALDEMEVKQILRYNCFLCHEFHDSINRTCDGCPMEGHWPNIDKNKPPVTHCFDRESVYSDIEYAFRITPNKIKRILNIMKTRLKELKDEKESN